MTAHDVADALETHWFWVLMYTTHGTASFQKRVQTQRTGRRRFRNVYRWICERGRTIGRAAIGLLSTTPGRSTNSNTVLFDELQT